jgi:photosystem II stability/assembly factor-like uncharacterized protein
VLTRATVLALLTAAAVATLWPSIGPFFGDLSDGVVGASEPTVTVPLEGTWETIANGDRINTVVVDGDTLWVAAEYGGVVRWDLGTLAYRQYLAPQDGLPANDVNDVALDGDGTLWAATGRGLAYMESDVDRFVAITPDNSPGMPARRATALAPRPDGKMWVGFAQEWDAEAVDPTSREPGTFLPGGLALYNPSTGAWEEEYHVEYEGDWANPRFKYLTSENITKLALGTDGILWVGTEPYFVWDPNTISDPDGPKEPGWWQLAGGGLAATKDGQWTQWHAGQNAAAGCYSDIIRDLYADRDGWMWVAASDGLLLMRNGLTKVGCEGQVRYRRARRDAPGMRASSVYSVAVGPDRRVWAGHAEGRKAGVGVGILDYNGTVEDFEHWDSNDYWNFVDIDDEPGPSKLIVSEIQMLDDGRVVMGTKGLRHGDGDGLRLYSPRDHEWKRLRTADDGLPSNYITDVERNPVTGDLWVSTRYKGVARFDGEHWRSWRMFGPGEMVARTTVNATDGISSIPTDFADHSAFEAAFPTHPRYARIGDDSTLYRVTGFTISSKAIRLTPKLKRPAPAGTPIYAVDRGPASDFSTQIAIDADGGVWIGGRESTWLGNCPTWPHCWLDGGAGYYDGERWTVYDLSKADTGLDLQDQEVESLEIDESGRVWIGTGNPFEGLDGKGIFVFDPDGGSWSLFNVKGLKAANFGSDGIADMDMDPETGDMWVAHHSVEVCDQSSPFGDACQPSFKGGGISHWDGQNWRTWNKRKGATMRAAGPMGEFGSVKVDRGRGLVWAGTFDDSAPNFHWLQGKGVNAALNWCPLDCGNEDWENIVWPDDGEVVALELDDTGNLWVGASRYGTGDVPPEGGVHILSGETWYEYNPENSGMQAREITSLSADGDEMWVGSFKQGIAHYVPIPMATPTPLPTKTPIASETATARSTDELTPTPRGTSGPTSTAGTPGTPGTVAPPCGQEGGVCHLYAPLALQRRACSPHCPTLPPPTVTMVPSATATRGGPSATATQAGEGTPTATYTGSQTPGVTPTQGPSNTPTDTPSPSRTLAPTATRTPTRTSTPRSSPTPTTPPVQDWREFSGTVPRDDFFSVDGIDGEHVWFAGDRSQVLFWDGAQMNQQLDVIPPDKRLLRVHMTTATRGYLLGEGGVFMETRNGGQLWRRTSGLDLYGDDWAAIDLVSVGRGNRGWALGRLNGNRLYYDGATWSPPSPGDRNNRTHKYADVVMLSDSKAYAIQNNTNGARIYEWDGDDWSPGKSTGPLNDMHVISGTLGVAVGARGSVWWLGDDGEWAKIPGPRTGGQDLNAVHLVARDQVWAAGGRGQIWLWDGAQWLNKSVAGKIKPIYSLWVSPDGSEGWAVGGSGQFLRYGGEDEP